MEKGKNNYFTVEKPKKYYLSHMNKVDINRDKLC